MLSVGALSQHGPQAIAWLALECPLGSRGPGGTFGFRERWGLWRERCSVLQVESLCEQATGAPSDLLSGGEHSPPGPEELEGLFFPEKWEDIEEYKVGACRSLVSMARPSCPWF